MGFFDFLKKKTATNPTPAKPNQVDVTPGKSCAERIDLDYAALEQMKQSFIAFDVETTGLNPSSDRIVELGAALFVNGEKIRTFSSLVNPHISIPTSVTSINHITNDMIATAPIEENVFPKFLGFLGDAINRGTIICAHNAQFDLSFLCKTLSRLGFDANLRYVDTLSLSRRLVKGLENYKQETVGAYFGLTNRNAHRADSDAEICGMIMGKLLEIAEPKAQVEKKKAEAATLKPEELEVCAFIQDTIQKNGGEVKWLRFRKDSSGYVETSYLYSFLKFKFAKKGKYFIVEKEYTRNSDLPIEPCSASEGGTIVVRAYFDNPLELKQFTRYIVKKYKDTYKSFLDYLNLGSFAKAEVERVVGSWTVLSYVDVDALLKSASNRDYSDVRGIVKVDQTVSRDSVVINAVHNRCPLSEIKNLGDWDKGFKDGYKYWERGEAARAQGDLTGAIKWLDKARYQGYEAPALYDSYAKVYHQLKDYDNEIVIIEEFLSRETYGKEGSMAARRDKAIKALFAIQEAERKAKEKELAQQEKAAKKEAEKLKKDSEPKQPKGRAILQMTDEGEIIKEYSTIAAAVAESGVSSKSIRDAANGIQKHAGGYCWKYKD